MKQLCFSPLIRHSLLLLVNLSRNTGQCTLRNAPPRHVGLGTATREKSFVLVQHVRSWNWHKFQFMCILHVIDPFNFLHFFPSSFIPFSALWEKVRLCFAELFLYVTQGDLEKEKRKLQNIFAHGTEQPGAGSSQKPPQHQSSEIPKKMDRYQEGEADCRAKQWGGAVTPAPYLNLKGTV